MRREKSPVVLQMENVSHSFGHRPVFQNVHAEVPHGEALIVTGRNGSGKSTLLRIIAGLLRPERGVVRLWDGERDLSLRERRQAIGMVAPDLHLYGELTALENLRFFARVRSLPLTDADLETLLHRVGLPERGHDLVQEFSSGMRVRLKYAQALMHEPELLILDEPTVNLDEEGVAFVDEVIQQQRERGILVLATNDPRETRHGDQVLSFGG